MQIICAKCGHEHWQLLLANQKSAQLITASLAYMPHTIFTGSCPMEKLLYKIYNKINYEINREHNFTPATEQICSLCRLQHNHHELVRPTIFTTLPDSDDSTNNTNVYKKFLPAIELCSNLGKYATTATELNSPVSTALQFQLH